MSALPLVHCKACIAEQHSACDGTALQPDPINRTRWITSPCGCDCRDQGRLW